MVKVVVKVQSETQYLDEFKNSDPSMVTTQPMLCKLGKKFSENALKTERVKMGFRVRLGPVSVGNKSAGINVGPVSASMAYKSKGGGSSASSLSAGDMFTMLMVVGFWQLTFPHFLNK